MKTLSLFPTPVMKTSLGRDFTKDELQFLTSTLTLQCYKDEQRGATNHQSKDTQIFNSYLTELKDIKKFCEDQLKKYMEEIEGTDTNIAGLKITQSWLNVNKPQEYHQTHIHPNSYLSGVLYIRCLSNDYIVITNRMQGMFNNIEFSFKKNTDWNSNRMGISVQEGDLILFPSSIPHYVDMNSDSKNRERISLSFNTFPIGELGNHDDMTHLKIS